jgi:hypothetical protein
MDRNGRSMEKIFISTVGLDVETSHFPFHTMTFGIPTVSWLCMAGAPLFDQDKTPIHSSSNPQKGDMLDFDISLSNEEPK